MQPLTIGDFRIVLQVSNDERRCYDSSNHSQSVLQPHDSSNHHGKDLVRWKERRPFVNLFEAPRPLRLQQCKQCWKVRALRRPGALSCFGRDRSASGPNPQSIPRTITCTQLRIELARLSQSAQYQALYELRESCEFGTTL